MTSAATPITWKGGSEGKAGCSADTDRGHCVFGARPPAVPLPLAKQFTLSSHKALQLLFGQFHGSPVNLHLMQCLALFDRRGLTKSRIQS
jgi:hypothetical protein